MKQVKYTSGWRLVLMGFPDLLNLTDQRNPVCNNVKILGKCIASKSYQIHIVIFAYDIPAWN